MLLEKYVHEFINHQHWSGAVERRPAVQDIAFVITSVYAVDSELEEGTDLKHLYGEVLSVVQRYVSSPSSV